MPDWTLDTYEVVAVVALAGAVLCLLLLAVVLVRLGALSRRLRRVPAAGADGGGAGVDARALRHVAVVRYDAFGDMGGALSFSAALYDDNGDGLVISSINGRSETRTYAKGLAGLKADQTLSPEEQEAIEAARRQ